MKDQESTQEEAAWEKEPTDEDLELEEPIPEVIEEDDDLAENEDPVHLYLHEIGRVSLLDAINEKIAARRIEIGRRISAIKQDLEAQGRQAACIDVFQEIILELGRSSEIIYRLREYLGLPENTSFCQIIPNDKIKTSINGVIDQLMVQSIAEKLDLSPESIASRLIDLSIDVALLPEKVLTIIGSKYSLDNISNLVMQRIKTLSGIIVK
jgi:hypothetical protein